MIYRYPKEGQIAGVCVGLAKHFGLNTRVVRLIFVILFFLGGIFFLPLIYCAAVFLMEKAPDYYYAVAPAGPFNAGDGVTPPSEAALKINKIRLELEQIKRRTDKVERYARDNKFRNTW